MKKNVATATATATPLITRAKRMAGRLGRTPTPTEFITRFSDKGVHVTMPQARSIAARVRAHRRRCGYQV